MKIVIYAAITILALIIQSTFFTPWPFFVVVPDLILVLVVLFSVINGPVFGLKFGFLAGLGVDILLGEMIGLNALTKMIVGAAVGLVSLRFYKENYIVPFISVVLATAVDQVLYASGLLLFGKTAPFAIIFEKFIIPLLLYNGILGVLLYLRLYYFNRRILYWDELVKRAR